MGHFESPAFLIRCRPNGNFLTGLARTPTGAAEALRRTPISRFALTGLFGILLCLALSYGALVTLSTSSFYQAKSLNAALKKSEDELARNRSRIIERLKSIDPSASEGLINMQDAAAGIFYVHANAAIVNASRPQP